MDKELTDLMINVAKEVNKKYEQMALEEAEQNGIKKGKKEGMEKGKKEGMEKGIEKGKKEVAKKLKKIHTPEEIAQITGLNLQTILLL